MAIAYRRIVGVGAELPDIAADPGNCASRLNFWIDKFV